MLMHVAQLSRRNARWQSSSWIQLKAQPMLKIPLTAWVMIQVRQWRHQLCSKPQADDVSMRCPRARAHPVMPTCAY